MRPRHYAAENARGRSSLFNLKQGFNEAAALRRGKHHTLGITSTPFHVLQ